MTPKTFLTKFENMPITIQQQVVNFADFLMQKEAQDLEQKKLAYAKSFQKAKTDKDLQELNEDGFEDYLQMIENYETK